VVSPVSEADGLAINASSGGFAPGVSEFEACQIARLPGSLVQSPRVASARAALESEVYEVEHLPPRPDGRITWWLAACWASISPTRTSIKDGLVDERALSPLTPLRDRRQGDIVEINRPG
jgi:flavin reductase (DIM6/NTAB) family NADH-FMN oxidoreductase RutF